MSDQVDSLVVWGSTGRRLQFSIQDLRMPENLRDQPHFHFYEKQWGAVASFWFNRVLKESSLQHLTVEHIVELIREDISKRWERRRKEQSIHKKRKRLLHDGGPAGTPSAFVLLTNVTTLEDYNAASEMEQRDLVAALVERVEAVSKDKVKSWEVLVDDEPEQLSAKAVRVEGIRSTSGKQPDSVTDASADFDDRVAVVLNLSSKEKAATAIAHLHGSKFDNRRVLCRFWSNE
ncbi:hypothetical protein LSCM1_05471 [Leishmania martiniquensis]|uniref:Uncharacterized protein n=1 Tax=Leishmania martiniquensis TaxID=1580590 RepID=A0A836KQ70_9TRYP|nr:hypothetical protein LSCM1_05471 [Leishmania martiniquensis]